MTVQHSASQCSDTETARKRFLISNLDPRDIWDDVQALSPFRGSSLRACCEIAFARIAIMKIVLERTQIAPVRDQLFTMLDGIVLAEFGNDDEEARLLYGAPLRHAAAEAIALYYEHGGRSAALTTLLLSRVGATADGLQRAMQLFERFGNEFGFMLCRQNMASAA